MATIDDLIRRISDAELRDRLGREINDLKKRLDWGLVFERHLPENTRLVLPIKPGAVVWERRSAEPRRLRVRGVEGADLVVVAEPKDAVAPADLETFRISASDVLVEKDFAESVFPALTSLGSIRNGPDDRPSHAVIEGENFHVIEMLLAAYEGQVDCLYLDPPYNTGAHDWSYNNDFVDPNDQYAPSKWLAFMERRLLLGRRLLKDDGVIVVTIDEHEVHHLGMLLEQVFPDARIQMATIVITPSGIEQDRLSRVEEYAYFCFFGSAPKPLSLGDDLLQPEAKIRTIESSVAWESLLRRGTGSARADRPSMFYPILIDAEAKKVVGVGGPMLEGNPDPSAKIEGHAVAWPIRTSGDWGRWRLGAATLKTLVAQGYVKVGGYDSRRNTWTLTYLGDKTRKQIEAKTLVVASRDANGIAVVSRDVVPRVSVKTVWNRSRHNAGVHGSTLLSTFLGSGGVFAFPKSLYAVRDTLDILTHDKPNALILDFFAGSGTTLHATMLLNGQDGRRRRCVLVTNNEVNYQTAAALNRQGHFRGDPAFEAAGVFQAACRPRITAALTGRRPDGQPIPGNYLDGGNYADGLSENVEFFRLDYLDPMAIELGVRFAELHPLLWLTAGGVGEREDINPNARYALPAASPYAVLFDPSGLADLVEGLASRPDVRHVFIVADSDQSFEDLARAIPEPERIKTVALYRDYLEALRGARR